MKILIAGEGGQGVQVIAQILAKAAFYQNLASLYIPNFGVEQRGGQSVAFVTIERKPIYYPKFDKADMAAILSPRSEERLAAHLGPGTKIIYGPSLKSGLKTALPNQVWNMRVLGQINCLGNLVKTQTLIKAVHERFAQQYCHHPELKVLNTNAINEK